MKNKEEIFKLLRESVEDEREAKIVEDLVNKITFTMPPIELVGEGRVKCESINYREDTRNGHYTAHIYLHRLIYSYFYGEIPDGFEVHHKDLNPANNDISNLKLLTKSQHSKIHGKIRRKEVKRQCAICGKFFTVPAKSTQKFCSYACAGKAHSKNSKEFRQCKFCGKIFSTGKKSFRSFCSKSCASKANTVSGKYNAKESRQCAFCRKIFSVYKSSPQKFCSMNCAGKARRKQITRQCPCCGKIFTFSKYLDQKFCSRSCSAKFRAQNAIEEKACLFCGKTFKSFKWKRQKYCCRACSAQARWKNNK